MVVCVHSRTSGKGWGAAAETGGEYYLTTQQETYDNVTCTNSCAARVLGWNEKPAPSFRPTYTAPCRFLLLFSPPPTPLQLLLFNSKIELYSHSSFFFLYLFTCALFSLLILGLLNISFLSMSTCGVCLCTLENYLYTPLEGHGSLIYLY